MDRQNIQHNWQRYSSGIIIMKQFILILLLAAGCAHADEIIEGNLTVNGTMGSTGNATVGGTLTVTSFATLVGNTTTFGAATQDQFLSFEGGADGTIQWDASANRFISYDTFTFNELIKTGASGWYDPGSNLDQDVTIFTADLLSKTPGMIWDQSEDTFDILDNLRADDVTGERVFVSGDATYNNQHIISGATFNFDFGVQRDGTNTGFLGGVALDYESTVALLAPSFYGFRSNGTRGARTVVTDGDTLARFWAGGWDGTDYEPGAEIRYNVDGTPANNVMYGGISFLTNNGSQTLTERMYLTPAGALQMSATGSIDGGTGVTAAGFSTDVDGGGILLGSGDDDKVGLIANVTGLPEFGSWDESEDAFFSDADWFQVKEGTTIRAEMGYDGSSNGAFLAYDSGGVLGMIAGATGIITVDETIAVRNSSIFGTTLGGFSSAGVLTAASDPPASAAATGTAGTITWDSNFIYVCVAANTWKRVAIATW